MKPEQTAAMIKVAGKGPQQRKSEIDQTRAEAGYDTQRFNDWGVKIDPEMVSLFFLCCCDLVADVVVFYWRRLGSWVE